MAVGLVARGATMVAVHAHGAVAVIVVHRATRGVDGNLMVIDPQAVALRVTIAEQPPLQHAVGREADAGHDVGRVEGRLLDLGMVVRGVAVERQHADIDQGVVAVRPDLGQVEGVVRQRRGLPLRHDLHLERPLRVLAALDGLVEIALVRLAVAADQCRGLGIGQVPDALATLEVELHPVALVPRVDEAESMAAETVHVAIAGRDATIRHDDGDLVQRLRQQGPEIPVALCAAQMGARVALDRVVEVGELERIAQEEHRRVVAHQIPVALLGIELDRETADVALGIRRAALAGDGRETDENLRLPADRGKQLRPGVAADVVGHGEAAMGAGALGMHAPLGDHLAVEMRQLLQEPDILQQHRSARPRRQDILVVRHGAAAGRGQLVLVVVIAHRTCSSGLADRGGVAMATA